MYSSQLDGKSDVATRKVSPPSIFHFSGMGTPGKLWYTFLKRFIKKSGSIGIVTFSPRWVPLEGGGEISNYGIILKVIKNVNSGNTYFVI